MDDEYATRSPLCVHLPKKTKLSIVSVVTTCPWKTVNVTYTTVERPPASHRCIIVASLTILASLLVVERLLEWSLERWLYWKTTQRPIGYLPSPFV